MEGGDDSILINFRHKLILLGSSIADLTPLQLLTSKLSLLHIVLKWALPRPLFLDFGHFHIVKNVLYLHSLNKRYKRHLFSVK